MATYITELLLYFVQLVLLTLGSICLCGLAVRICSRAFAAITGSGAIFDATSIIGTPVHELGHAVMCLIFGHKIQKMKLWSLRPTDGVYGFVEHSYSRKNPWAVLGNLFIGVGPIFSGMAVVIMALCIFFPTQWSTYLSASASLPADTAGLLSLFKEAGILLLGIFSSIWKSPLYGILGILLILSVSLHITLSWQDIKGCLSSLPLYLLICAVFCTLSGPVNIRTSILSFLWVANFRLICLFFVVFAFSLLWVILALLWRGLKKMLTWF